MEIEISKQALAFLWSLVVGGVLGGFYDIFRIIRILWKHGAIGVFLEDLIFSFSVAIITFLSLARINDGQPRLYLLLGEGCGFILYLNTIGCLTAAVGRFLSMILQKIKRYFCAWRRFVLEKMQKNMNFLKKLFIFLFQWCKMLKNNLKRRRTQDGKIQKSKKT